MKKYNNKLLAIGFSIIGIVILTIIGLSYAFFTANVIGNQNANQTVITTADLKLVFNDTDILDLNNALPGARSSKTFTVTNIGNVRQRYDINITNVINEFTGGELVYSITSDNEDGGEVQETAMPIEDATLLTSSIDPGVTITYEITVKFKETGSTQDYNQGASFSGKLQIASRIMGVALGGYVYDENDNALSGITVELNSDPIIVETNEEGYYEIEEAPIGIHTLYIKQGETVLGSKEITLLSSAETRIQNNNTLYLPEKNEKYINIKIENELNLYVDSKLKEFIKTFGGSNYDYFTGGIPAVDGYILVGYSNSTNHDLTGLNKGGQDAIIVKYDLNGNLESKKTFGGSENDQFSRIIPVSDGYIIIGNSLSTNGDLNTLNKGATDAIIVKYDKTLNNIIWKKTFGGTGHDYFHDIIEVSDGYILIGSSTSSDKDLVGLNKGYYDAIIVKYDLEGNVVWKKNYGGSQSDNFLKINCTQVECIVVGNSYSTNGDLSGLNKGNSDAIIVKYDLNGNIIFNKTFGGSLIDIFYDVKKISDGYLAVGSSNSTNGDLSGLTIGGDDAIIVKFDLNGNMVWVKIFGGSEHDRFTRIIKTEKELIIVGHSESNNFDLTELNKGKEDLVIVKYDLNGTLKYKNSYGGNNSEYLLDALYYKKGYILIGSSNSTTGDFNGLNKGGQDGLIYVISE